ncbi:hypothetical protein R3P38DRAFT_3168252 [Favolaschia claudopus]|uniref:Uncharacterized protein n=1 Tax=Favolaschia claudopus TaxID=2862362 RepID=A0AAW0E7D0_9AGAR
MSIDHILNPTTEETLSLKSPIPEQQAPEKDLSAEQQVPLVSVSSTSLAQMQAPPTRSVLSPVIDSSQLAERVWPSKPLDLVVPPPNPYKLFFRNTHDLDSSSESESESDERSIQLFHQILSQLPQTSAYTSWSMQPGYHFYHIRRVVRKIPPLSAAYEVDDSPPTSVSASQTAAGPWYLSAAASESDEWDELDEEEAAGVGDEEDDVTVARSDGMSPFLEDIYAANAPEYAGLQSEREDCSAARESQLSLGDNLASDPLAQAEGRLIVGLQKLQ